MDDRDREELEGLLSRSLDGELDPEGEERLAGMLAESAEARQALDEWVGLHERLARALAAPSRGARARVPAAGPLWRMAAAAAVILGALLAFYSGVRVGRGRAPAAEPAARVAQDAAVPATDRRVPAQPARVAAADEPEEMLLLAGDRVPVKVRNAPARRVIRIPIPDRDLILEMEQERESPRVLIPVDY